MGKHNSFWHSCGATSVDESCTVARFAGIHSFLHILQVNSSAFFHELFPVDDFTSEGLQVCFRLIIDNYQLYFSCLEFVHVFFRIFHVLRNNDFAFRVLHNVLANFVTVGCVDASGETAAKQTSKECDCPFRRVKSYNVDRSMLRESKCNQAGGKVHALLIVFFES